MKLAVRDDSHAGMQARIDHRRAWRADANARLTGRWCATRLKNAPLSRAAGG